MLLEFNFFKRPTYLQSVSVSDSALTTGELPALSLSLPFPKYNTLVRGLWLWEPQR